MAGAKRENIWMFDTKGCVTKDRKDLNKYKQEFAQEKGFASLADGVKGADVFIGLSVGGVMKKDMVKSMAKDPIIFAMANPDPEIMYDEAISVRDDLIMATGRSDFPNQVNNVLGFPFIFRGALDVRATAINEEMKMAATIALAKLAKEKVPEMVLRAYGGEDFSFGKEYIIPKPFDPRVLWYVAPAVAKAAIETGVAKIKEMDWPKYEEKLKERLGLSKELIRVMIHKAQKKPVKVVYPEGEEEKIIRAAHVVYNDNMAYPILIGNEKVIKSTIDKLEFDQKEFQIVDPDSSERIEQFTDAYFKKRSRKGATIKDTKSLMKKPNYFGSMMVELGEADALISGLTTSYPTTIRPALHCVGMKEGLKVVSGLYIIFAKQDVYFFADTSVNVNPTAEQLAQIAISTADTVREFDVIPKVAMLSFSNFGSAPCPDSLKVKQATDLVKKLRPDLMIDGEMQADTAVIPEIIANEFPFSTLKGRPNILIFPDLNSGNIAYKLMARIGQASVVGPILMGMKKPIHVLQLVACIANLARNETIAVAEAGAKKK